MPAVAAIRHNPWYQELGPAPAQNTPNIDITRKTLATPCAISYTLTVLQNTEYFLGGKHLRPLLTSSKYRKYRYPISPGLCRDPPAYWCAEEHCGYSLQSPVDCCNFCINLGGDRRGSWSCAMSWFDYILIPQLPAPAPTVITVIVCVHCVHCSLLLAAFLPY